MVYSTLDLFFNLNIHRYTLLFGRKLNLSRFYVNTLFISLNMYLLAIHKVHNSILIIQS